MDWPTAFIWVCGMACCGLPAGLIGVLLLMGLFVWTLEKR
jgi:uncharacterized protein (DUF2062 family)